MLQIHDYEGVSMMSRDANQKAAASEATNIFQNHYPEFLVRSSHPPLALRHKLTNVPAGDEVLHQRPHVHVVGLLDSGKSNFELLSVVLMSMCSYLVVLPRLPRPLPNRYDA